MKANWILSIQIGFLIFLNCGIHGKLSKKDLGGSNLAYVDPFIGTGGEGFGIGSVPPGAQVPFGLVRLSPDSVFWDNIFLPFNHFGGYYYGDDYIRIFSHTHMVGSGIVDYGTIGVMPVSSYPDSDMITNYGFRSSFSHQNEDAFPGYYNVLLLDPNINVELTASTHVGHHRYTYLNHQQGQNDMFVLFDVSHALTEGSCYEYEVNIDTASQSISGYSLTNGGLSSRFGGIRTYFYATFNETFNSDSFGVWNQSTVYPNVTSMSASSQGGSQGGAFVSFTIGGNSVEISVGISFISILQAQINLQKEVNTQSFNDTLDAAMAVWNDNLNTININSFSDDETIKFYTSFYHTLLAPTTFSETSNNYLGFDNQVHDVQSPQVNYYTDMSIWDVHRTQMPWLVLLRPDVMIDVVRSLIVMYTEGGDLPKWPLANGYTNCMDGQHSFIMITDAYFKNLTDFDVATAYQAMYMGATQSRPNGGRTDIKDYINLGYVPYEVDNHGCTDVLGYSFDDWALANLAGALGKQSDEAMFRNRSTFWKNVFNTEYNFMCPRTQDGGWNCPDTWINVFDDRYVEGDAWHYRTFVPHDIPELINAFNGSQNFVNALDDFFYYGQFDTENILPNPYYWAGNEEDLLAVWQFNYASRPDLTQQYSRWLLDNEYSIYDDGIPGNDDYGAMSAWFTFASLGFYPLAGSTTYTLGSPLFNDAKISTPNGPIQIIAYNNSATNIYVEKVSLNGNVLNEPFIDHKQLFNSVIEFWMTENPSNTYNQ